LELLAAEDVDELVEDGDAELELLLATIVVV